MNILNKLMEKKDLRTYIEFRIKFLEQERYSEILKSPESEREFLSERFLGIILELKKLKEALNKDLIKHDSKIYYRKVKNE